MKSNLFIIIIFINCLPLIAQISHGGKPLSMINKKNYAIPFIKMPNFDLEDLLFEDQQNDTIKNKPLRFAKTFTVNESMFSNALFDTLSNNHKIALLGIHSKGAYSLNFTFSTFNIPKGAAIYVYNPQKTILLGAFTYQNITSSKVLTISPIKGDSIIIEYNEPPQVSFQSQLIIGQVGHDYRNIFNLITTKDGNFGSSGYCNIDINCSLGNEWQIEKQAVCRIMINNSELCSGAMINNIRNNAKPYFLTANHCVSSPTEANSLLFVFNYESPTCNGIDGSVLQTLSGATLRATTNRIDFALVEMSSLPPKSYNPYLAGWSVSADNPTVCVAIHHPNGDVKKISKDNDMATNATYTGYDANTHWRIGAWNYGTTESGSSGCPLFNASHQIVGCLTGGFASCTNTNGSDYFAKTASAWANYSQINQQLKYWLDPDNTGATSCAGLNPYNNNCDTITNINDNENLGLFRFETEWGYWTGHNEFHDNQFAEKFYITNTGYISGVWLGVAKSYAATSQSKIVLKIWSGSTYPTTLLTSKDILLNTLTPSYWNYIPLSNSIQVSNNFFIGYEIFYNTPSDTFALISAEERGSTGSNTAYCYNANTWYPFSSFSFYTSLGIEAKYCTSVDIDNAPNNKTSSIKLFPNPANNILNITLSDIYSKSNNIIIIEIYNGTGTLVQKNEYIHYNELNIQYDINHFAEGLYYIKIYNNSFSESQKCLIVR